MENKTIEPTNLRPSSNHIIDASLVKIDVINFIVQIKNEKLWIGGDRNAITVFKTNGLSIVLIALHQNARMNEQYIDELINIQILEGEIQLTTDNESIYLKAGEILVLHSRIKHSILATEETTFLLTVTSSTKQFTD